MTDELVFYTNPLSRGRTVRWMLEEIGQPYRAEIVSFGPEMKAAAYTAINPMGKVPAITHRGVVVTEAAAILSYLADAFPGAGLAPDVSDAARGPYYRWLHFCAGPLEYALINRAFGFQVTPENRGRIGYGTYEDVLNTVEKAVGRTKFLAGGRFSAADLYMTANLGWGMLMGNIERRPAFEAYVGHHIMRPAAVKARAMDDALAPLRA
jgi:glutathione S-transferase